MNKILTYLFLLTSTWVLAQDETNNLYEGNKAYNDKKFTKSEAKFRASTNTNKSSKATSFYNLGNSIYKSNQPNESKYSFFQATELAKTKEEKHKAFHNLGNAFMKDKDYANAVDSYKNALRNNPTDEETRYNYALAKKMLKDNPPPNSPKDEGDGKDSAPQENDNQKQPKPKNDNSEKEKQQENQPKPSGQNQQQIESILEAVNNAEQELQQKVNSRKEQRRSNKNEKDW